MNYVQEIESIFSDIDSCITEATNMSKNLLEYTKNKNNLYWMTESKGDSVKEKVKQLVNKVKEALQKIVNFFKEKTFKKAIENTKKNKEQVKLKGIHPDKKKKILTSSLNVLTTKAKEFKSMRGYNKISVPTAFALGWTPLLAPVPGASEILIALSSIGDFLLDYKRLVCNQGAPAIDDFNRWVENNINRLEEVDIYQTDKILSRMTSWISYVSGEIKRLSLSAVSKSFKLGEKLTKDESTKNRAMRILSKKSERTLDNYDKYKKKRKDIQEKKKNSKNKPMHESVKEVQNILLNYVGDDNDMV